jgi:hypothetical protein
MFDLSLICMRDLTESDFLQEMRLGGRCLYVLIEINAQYSVPVPDVCHSELLTFAT